MQEKRVGFLMFHTFRPGPGKNYLKSPNQMSFFSIRTLRIPSYQSCCLEKLQSTSRSHQAREGLVSFLLIPVPPLIPSTLLQLLTGIPFQVHICNHKD